MNKIILMGRLTRDAEIRYTQGENPFAVARFTLAVDRPVKGEKKEADFISCVAFRKTAELLEKYGKKGTPFALEGEIRTGSYTDKDGNKRYTTDVHVNRLEFVPRTGSNAEDAAQPAQQTTQTTQTYDGFMNIPEGIDEELPFN